MPDAPMPTEAWSAASLLAAVYQTEAYTMTHLGHRSGSRSTATPDRGWNPG